MSDLLVVKSKTIRNIAEENKDIKSVLSSINKHPLEGEVEINNKKLKLSELTEKTGEILREKANSLDRQEEHLATFFEEKKGELQASKIRVTRNDLDLMLKKTPVRRIEGIGDAIASKFAKIDVVTLFDLLTAGRTADDRLKLSKMVDIPPESIDEWLRIVDLFRLSGMDTQFTHLFIRAGVSSVSDLANRNPRELHGKLLNFMKKSKIVRRVPGISEISRWVEEAKILGPSIDE